MSLDRDASKRILDRVLALSRADECFASLTSRRDANIRFARNEVTTSGDVSDTVLSVRSSFGSRSGSSTVNQLDEASLERCVRQAEEIARFAPEDPEHVAVLGAQDYAPGPPLSAETVDLPPERRAEVARDAVVMAKQKDVVIAGFLTNGGGSRAIASSKGLFGHTVESQVTFSSTARTPDGTGSGWGGTNGERWGDFEAAALARTAVDKAHRSAKPRELAPGTYTVVLEPAAVADLVLYLGFSMDARQADEGRSFFARKGGGNRIGDTVFSDRFSIWTDPADPRAQGAPFAADGLPTRRRAYVENGVVKDLSYSRFWAQKQGKEPSAQPTNILMAGGKGSVADLVRDTRRGVLVTRLWYIRFVDPQTILLTGLTRDGTFLIEDGKVRHAVKNFRWNDSPVSIFSKVEAMGAPVRARGAEAEDFAIVCPAVRTRMTFSSLSDAV